MDEEIVREEYERLIREIEEGKSDAVHRVMEEDEYEDEFSHNAIDEMHSVLFDMTKEYLHYFKSRWHRLDEGTCR